MNVLSWEIGGVPLHPLIVHGAVVLIPLAALMIALAAAWPAAARRLGALTPAVAGAALGFAVLAHVSGERLLEQVDVTDAVDRHAGLAEAMNLVALGLVMAAGALWAWQRRLRRGTSPRRRVIVDIAVSAFAVTMAAVAMVEVAIVGHSGATAVWGG